MSQSHIVSGKSRACVRVRASCESTTLRCSSNIHKMYPQANCYTQSTTTPSLWKADIISLSYAWQNRIENAKEESGEEQTYPAEAVRTANLQAHSPLHLLALLHQHRLQRHPLPRRPLQQLDLYASKPPGHRPRDLQSHHLLRPRRR